MPCFHLRNSDSKGHWQFSCQSWCVAIAVDYFSLNFTTRFQPRLFSLPFVFPPPPALCVCTLDGGNAEPPRIANIVIYLAVSVCLCAVLLGNFQSLAEPRTNNRRPAPAPWEEVALPLDQLGGLGGHAPWGGCNLQVDRGKESYALGWLCRAVFSSFYHLWTWSCAEFCQMAWVVTE